MSYFPQSRRAAALRLCGKMQPFTLNKYKLLKFGDCGPGKKQIPVLSGRHCGVLVPMLQLEAYTGISRLVPKLCSPSFPNSVWERTWVASSVCGSAVKRTARKRRLPVIYVPKQSRHEEWNEVCARGKNRRG